MLRQLRIAAALLLLAAGTALADSGLPFQDFSLGPQYQSVKSTSAGPSPAGTMYGLDMAFNGSYLDSLLNGSNNKLRFGDYVGAHATLSDANYASGGSQYFIGLGFSLGVQAGLAVTDYLDVGARYYVDCRDNKFGSPDNAQALNLNTSVFMVRVANIYLDAGAGNGKKSQGNETCNSSLIRLRYLFAEGGYAGVMLDTMKIKYDLLDREDTIRNIVIQFGLSH